MTTTKPFGYCQFADIFETWREWHHATDCTSGGFTWKGQPVPKANRDAAIGHYCRIGGQGEGIGLPFALWVTPSQKTLEYIRANMLPIDNDRIFFEVIPFDDGTATVYAKYGQIIGSRLLAEVPIASISEQARS